MIIIVTPVMECLIMSDKITDVNQMAEIVESTPAESEGMGELTSLADLNTASEETDSVSGFQGKIISALRSTEPHETDPDKIDSPFDIPAEKQMYRGILKALNAEAREAWVDLAAGSGRLWYKMMKGLFTEGGLGLNKGGKE